ncbi:hypothetical protein ACWCPO_28835 [Streptomyces albidoflavus]
MPSGEFGALIIGGGVGRESRAAMKECAAGHGLREMIDGALPEPFDAYVRREFEPLIRKASVEG